MIVRSTKREKERERERKRDRAKTYGGISAFTLDIVRDARRPLTSIVFEITEAFLEIKFQKPKSLSIRNMMDLDRITVRSFQNKISRKQKFEKMQK